MISLTVRYLTLLGMLATVAWFFWNPEGWTFKWDPIVAFIFALAGFIGSDLSIHVRKKKNEATHQNDALLFRKLIELMPSEGPIEFLHHHDFLSVFNIDILKPVITFHHDWDNAEHEFIDRDLEQLRLNLHKAINKFNSLIARYTSPNSSGFQAVRSERMGYSEAYEQKIRKEAALINKAADEVVEAHQKLIRLGRKKLDLS